MTFTRKKFINLSSVQKHNKIIKLVYKIYENWKDETLRAELISELINLLNWTNEKYLIKTGEDLSKVKNRENLRNFDKIIMPYLLQKKVNISENELIVYKNDFGRDEAIKFPIYLILDNLRSLYNVGSIFRSSECFGVKKIYCCGYTPTPKNVKIKKTAMGTENLVEWQQIDDSIELIKSFKKQGVAIYSMELTSKSIKLDNFQPVYPAAFVLGNEALGVSKEILDLSDKIVYIPLYGFKNSLNVASSAAILLNHLAGKFNKKDK